MIAMSLQSTNISQEGEDKNTRQYEHELSVLPYHNMQHSGGILQHPKMMRVLFQLKHLAFSFCSPFFHAAWWQCFATLIIVLFLPSSFCCSFLSITPESGQASKRVSLLLQQQFWQWRFQMAPYCANSVKFFIASNVWWNVSVYYCLVLKEFYPI